MSKEAKTTKPKKEKDVKAPKGEEISKAGSVPIESEPKPGTISGAEAISPTPELSETPVVDGEQANAPVEVEAPILTATDIVAMAMDDLRATRGKITENLKALGNIEDAIEACVREQVDLPQDIQLSALCGISSGTVIKVDKQNLDCVLLGQAKGQLVKRDGEVVLVIHKRTRVVKKDE